MSTFSFPKKRKKEKGEKKGETKIVTNMWLRYSGCNMSEHLPRPCPRCLHFLRSNSEDLGQFGWDRNKLIKCYLGQHSRGVLIYRGQINLIRVMAEGRALYYTLGICYFLDRHLLGSNSATVYAWCQFQQNHSLACKKTTGESMHHIRFWHKSGSLQDFIRYYFHNLKISIIWS